MVFAGEKWRQINSDILANIGVLLQLITLKPVFDDDSDLAKEVLSQSMEIDEKKNFSEAKAKMADIIPGGDGQSHISDQQEDGNLQPSMSKPSDHCRTATPFILLFFLSYSFILIKINLRCLWRTSQGSRQLP